MRFTLNPRQWYAAEIIGAEFSDSIRSYTPIKVLNVEPELGGRRVFSLDFYHATYPEGVRNKTYRLKTIERNQNFLLASSLEHEPNRLVLIYPISTTWLKEHFSANIDLDQSPSQWLEQNA